MLLARSDDSANRLRKGHLYAVKSRGFTLIELLIVVAIIAILAAIAVPNFLEAQVRAKVSRAKSDMRSLDTAIQAFAVDHNGILKDANDKFPMGSWNQKAMLHPLTTPVAYITSIPNDPFHSQPMNLAGIDPITAGFMQQMFPGDPPYPYIYNTEGENEDALGDIDPRQANNGGRPVAYGITSIGPNRFFDASTWNGYDPRINHKYDPTNGTNSRGDITRFGGPGQPPND